MLLKTWSFLNCYEFTEPDKFTSKLPLVGTPFQGFIVILLYLIFVLKLGPALMRDRPAFQLKTVLLAYNAFQVLFNFSFVLGGYFAIIHYRDYDIRCIVPLPDNHPHKWIEVTCCYGYYLDKFVDFLDTVFFVLRKSTRQITFLHLYHHVLMAGAGLIIMRYFGIGTHICVMGILNAFVHVLMYSYYFCSAFSQDLKNSLWWKKYITRIQIGQFLLIIIHQSYPLLFVSNCDKSSKIILSYFAILQSGFMLFFFTNFYIKTYIKSNKNMAEKIQKID